MIPFGRVIDELRRLGQAYPDRVAKCCLFGPDGKIPECIVGHAFINVGVEVAMDADSEPGLDANLVTPDGLVVGHSSDTIEMMHFKKIGLRQPTEKQLRWAFDVQSAQDSGYPWGEAVRSADEEARVLAKADA